MNNETILKLFEQTGALLKGHFLLTSGLHSDRYFQCARVLQYPEHAAKLCSQMVKPVKDQNVAAVIAPAIGGIIVGHEAGRALGTRALFAEREASLMRLRRGFEIAKGERILIVEDVVTTGGSVKEVIELVRDVGGLPVGVGCLVDRSAGRAEFGIPFHPLVSLKVETHPPESCPLCEQGLPAVKPGSRNLAS